MKKTLFLLVAVAVLGGCSSVETATVSSKEISAAGNESSVAVVQTSAIGLTAILHLVPIIPADLDTVVNKMLISEAKAMGASKVQIISANATPKHGIFMLATCPGIILCVPMAQATGIAVK